MYVIPKGETGKLELAQEGSANGREKCSESVFLGDQVVILGAKKHVLVGPPLSSDAMFGTHMGCCPTHSL